MNTQCNSKPLGFEGHDRRRLVAKKLIFLLRRLQNAAAGSLPGMATKGTKTQKERNDEKRPRRAGFV